jgi:SOS response regulatory protein OraA/RecX
MRDISFPCSSRILSYATTRSRRIDQGKGIDNKGIEPSIKLNSGTDWIREALKILEK